LRLFNKRPVYGIGSVLFVVSLLDTVIVFSELMEKHPLKVSTGDTEDLSEATKKEHDVYDFNHHVLPVNLSVPARTPRLPVVAVKELIDFTVKS
jgi:hypothetical protein